MPFGIGFFATAGVRAAAGSFDLLQTQILTSPTASIEFANLNSTYGATYQHLQIRMVYRGSAANDGETVLMRLNGDTGNNYSSHLLRGDGSGSPASSAELGLNSMEQLYTAGNNSAGFGVAVIDLLDAFETTKFKTRRLLAASGTNSNFAGIQLGSGSWRNTAATTSITILPRYGSGWATNSRFSLYGIKAA
jgi:hypothetical protein